MNSFNRKIMSVFTVVAIITASGFTFQDQTDVKQPETNAKPAVENKIEFPPVDNMHHFMEYISQPSYLALQKALSTQPNNRKEWKPIKVNALILAETSSLVADRCPEDPEQAKQWKQISRNVYDSGKGLYEAARKMKFKEAKAQYGLMIDSCNKCHQVFDEGKHQLEK